MGSAAALLEEPTLSNGEPIPPPPEPSGITEKGQKKLPVVAADNEMNYNKKGRKQKSLQSNEEVAGSRKRPKRAAACLQPKENSEWSDDESCLIEVKQNQVVQDEVLAIRLTDRQEDAGQGFPRRRLNNFRVHDGDGVPLPLEMIEDDKNEVFVSGLILPLEERRGKEKDCRVECRGFGRVKACKISGYKEGIPVILLTTEVAEYNCMKPISSYKMFYTHFFEKAYACVDVYKKLSKSSGGNPDLTLDELLAQTVRSMKASMPLCSAYVKDFIVSQGEFIYKQLEGLDETRMINDQKFIDLPAVSALLEESHNHGGGYPGFYPSNSAIRIAEGNKAEDKDLKSARLWQEVEYWNSVRSQKKIHVSGPSSKAVYIKINEDEIANDYPLPGFYKHNDEEIDEYIVFAGDDVVHPDDLPKRMLHNWSLYNSDSRFISLELLPMKPCEDIDVTIFGSGYMTEDDGSGFCLDNDSEQSLTWGSSEKDFIGMPIFLSDIKEWVIEFGPSMIFVSVRTDMAWYRLGKPSKQYAPWYKPVLKTAKLALSIITWLKEQSRVSKLSFTDVMKKVSVLEKDHLGFVSSDPSVTERYVAVHGQIIRQLFAEFPDKKIKSCAFLLGLTKMMEERRHTKWTVKKRDFLLKSRANLNPRATMCPGPALSKRKAMQATTTRLVNRIWGEFYSNYSPDDVKEDNETAMKEDEEVEEPEENEEEDEEDIPLVLEKVQEPSSASGRPRSQSSKKEVRWDGNPVCKLSSGENIYRQAIVHGETISVGSSVLLEVNDLDHSVICYVEYMHEASDGRKLCHGRIMQWGCRTVLGNASNEREVFLTNECMDIELQDIKQAVTVEIRKICGGHQHRKDQASANKIDRERAEARKKKGLPLEYFCKSLYWSERGAFFTLPYDTLGVGSGICHSCTRKQSEKEKERFKLYSSSAGFIYNGIDYYIHDFVYLDPYHFAEEMQVNETFKGGRNVGSKAYVIGQLLEINVFKELEYAEIEATTVKLRRFFRPEDISSEKAYCSDIREIYYSEETHVLPITMIEGKCVVRKRSDIPPCTAPAIFDHVFFCEHLYDPLNGSLKQLPTNVKLRYSTMGGGNDSASRKRKGKLKEGETDNEENKEHETPQRNCLDTLDIFAGCGGLSEGLQQAGVASTKWAIEYEEPAGEAFKLNHPESLVFVNNCNVILRAVMEKCGDSEDCIATSEAAEMAASLDEKVIRDLPEPGQVEFINGGPPCQGFSGMNRFNQGTWSKVQCEMILAFLSFADYFRPKYFLLENVRTFLSFNKGQTFRLTLASLLEMGYQMRFGILEAGTFGVAQSRKRAFIWAAAPEEVLPEWPEPMHVFAVPEMKIALTGNSHYAAVRSTAGGAPFRAITVRDTIGDLPSVNNGASNSKMEYMAEPVSWFQKKIRGNTAVLIDHISKEMNELNLIRCQKIPRRPGSDWRDLPDEKIKLSTGQLVNLIPWCLPNTAKRHNQWKGLFGRLDLEGNFPTSITDPQPMGKVGMCFHPEQDRIITVRECARSQGFPDGYQFAGTIHHKHRQIGNAVPPPLAYALGVKLKEALETKSPKH